MLQLLFDWEYPHWMMMAGTILVAAGFIGLAFHRNRNVETDQKKPGRERAKSDDTPEPETDLPEDEEPEDVPLSLPLKMSQPEPGFVLCVSPTLTGRASWDWPNT